MHVPINLRYTTNHLWLRSVGRNDIYIGITDYAQKEIGRIDSFDINNEGSINNIQNYLSRIKGKSFGTIYGANKTFDLIMPVTGEIFSFNTDIDKNPRSLNSDPYHNWLALISTKHDHLKGLKFLTADEYCSLIQKTFAK